jgi:hypothetical protein
MMINCSEVKVDITVITLEVKGKTNDKLINVTTRAMTSDP